MAGVVKAFFIALKAHKGQVDKGGKPYIFHPLYVASSLKGKEQKIVALLHDVVEDTEIELVDLILAGFSKSCIDAVDAITKRKNETYECYIDRVKNNAIARQVKIEDLWHNSQLSRLKEVTEKDLNRVEKYKKTMRLLLQ